MRQAEEEEADAGAGTPRGAEEEAEMEEEPVGEDFISASGPALGDVFQAPRQILLKPNLENAQPPTSPAKTLVRVPKHPKELPAL